MPRSDFDKYVLTLVSDWADGTELLLEESMEYPGNFWLYLLDGNDQVEIILTPEQMLELCMKGMVRANKLVARRNDASRQLL